MVSLGRGGCGRVRVSVDAILAQSSNTIGSFAASLSRFRRNYAVAADALSATTVDVTYSPASEANFGVFLALCAAH